ncbi:glycosyltransferase involved in cell wall biosynthesis [Stella humosa]|uniref:Glycosyltransferase involved in cell wall biosynthesis n=1 Tax=Stella humosa TaxID=94 RepID=A0A3N1L8W9_9PROT|nr:glycosyltransferase family 1 protein [Stella humosa]ROP91133.1 glycosyltransferase involved in cell wall biosynthesis [Stella humosa]BBK34515.1 GDP-mannose-dependent alpha-mannosyltransferase [Stella humosa]
MNLAIVSDAWHPQVNGVVRTLTTLKDELERRGHSVTVIAPDAFSTVPCPGYREIRLALLPGRGMGRRLDDAAPDAIHIATEGPLGMAARAYCRRRRLAFTTAFHTRFPDYVAARTGVPAAWLHGWMRRFHAPAARVMVATDSLMGELAGRGFRNLRRWSRGVDTTLFRPGPKDLYDLPRPIFLNVGRVAVEKNLEAFLVLDLPGTKVVVGCGPQRAVLAARHPGAVFVGSRSGPDLAHHFRAADVFVFPSRTDTFGLVMLEALASGVPVAAFPVPGPVDVVGGSTAGILSEDLGRAARAALNIPAGRCRAHAEGFSWARSADQFLDNLVPAR